MTEQVKPAESFHAGVLRLAPVNADRILQLAAKYNFEVEAESGRNYFLL
jgi:hypothetical protein